MDNAYHNMRSHDPTQYNFYALCIDQLDSLFGLVLINHETFQLSLDKTLNSTLVNTYSSSNNLETNKWSSSKAYGQTLQE
jgi:hypothetical protein